MTWVITSLCQDCVDMSCVDVCPVDCIVQFNSADANADASSSSSSWIKNQLYIDPNECIDCGVCEPECPWEAIFSEEEVPDTFHDDIALNARVLEIRDQFDVPENLMLAELPSPDDVHANKEKWGWDNNTAERG